MMLLQPSNGVKSLNFPCYGQIKYDGIRCLLTPEGPRTRGGKSIRNLALHQELQRLPVGLDGELVHWRGRPYAQSIVSSQTHPDTNEIKFVVFDYANPAQPFSERLQFLQEMPITAAIMQLAPTVILSTVKDFDKFYAHHEGLGEEGVVTRSPGGLYLLNKRANKQEAVKWKHLRVGQAHIVSVLESKRRPGHVASIGVRDASGISFSIGGGEGLTVDLRKRLWTDREKMVGRLVQYTYYDLKGCKPQAPQLITVH